MKNKTLSLNFVLCCLLSLNLFLNSCSEKEQVKEPESRPNILMIVLDDAGYSDLGPFGGEILTPSIDNLASEGIVFSQFSVTPNCSSTRASLLTGMDHHRTGMGTHGGPTENQKGKPGYEGVLNDRVITMAEVLQNGGYYTMMAGKWHLGNKQEHTWPSGRGFDKSFALLNGGASHWDESPLFPGKPSVYVDNGKPLHSFPNSFYSSDYFTKKIKEYIESNNNEKPFFAFLSFTAPHNPLHAPKDLIDKYEDQYKDGWDALQTTRLKQLKSSGMIDNEVTPQPRPEWIPAWESLDEEKKELAARDMAVYAAMIDRLDYNIGLLINQLKKMGAYENTMIFVFSDNGPSKTKIQDYLALAGADAGFMDNYNNTLDNRGLQNSSVDLGPGWAYGIAAPFRLMKGYQSQGGVLSPLIVKPPKKWNIQSSHINKPVHVMDIMPTFLEVANISHPIKDPTDELLEMQGVSMIPLIKGENGIDFENRGFGSELFGVRAYRKGEWKILKLPVPYGSGEWQLYNLKNDPGENNDLAKNHAEILEELSKLWEDYAKENGVVEPNKLSLYTLPPGNH